MAEPSTSFSSKQTRELRANNPLGVSVSRTYDWENVDRSNPGVPGKNGLATPGVDNKLGDHLVIFLTLQDGLNAAAWLLKGSYFLRGFTTPASIGNKWSGDATGGYGNSLAKIMRADPNRTLDYSGEGVSLMRALTLMENGHGDVEKIPNPYFTAAIAYGSTRA